MPLAIVSTFAGVWLVRRLDVERFNTIMYVLLLGMQLLLEALRWEHQHCPLPAARDGQVMTAVIGRSAAEEPARIA